jgi:8-oxo-dGTP diphosphatase
MTERGITVFTAALATLGYVLSPEKSQVLMIHRNTRPDDQHFGKYMGLGGQLEPGEDIVTGMCREIQEESGLLVDELVLRGTVALPDSAGFLFIFRIERWHGELSMETDEGTVEWVSRDALLSLPMWPIDYHFLPMVFDPDPRLFHGCLSSHEGEPGQWHCERA